MDSHLATQGIDHALIVGAGHGIGLGLTKTLLTRSPQALVHGTYRDSGRAEGLYALKETYGERLQLYQCDPTHEDRLAWLASELQVKMNKCDLLINCVGFLHDKQQRPEKSLNDISIDSLLRSFLVNSIVTPLLAKHLRNLFVGQQPSVFAALSARVGSIEDNHSGGWYGYRASKAALNMFLRNIALEYQGRNCNTLVLAIHPGTTITKLSEPYIQRTKYRLHTPEEAASHILDVIDHRSIADQASFWAWDGTPVAW